MTSTVDTGAVYAKIADHRTLVLGQEDSRLSLFRDEWLPSAVSGAELAQFAKVPASYLVSLYPRLYVQGPSAAKLERVVTQITALINDPSVSDSDKMHFTLQIVKVHQNQWGHIEDEGEWEALHAFCEQMTLGDLLIQGTGITAPDSKYLFDLLRPYVASTRSPTANALPMRALEVFTQLVLLHDLVDLSTLSCERYEDDYEPEDSYSFTDGTYIEKIVSYTEPLIYTQRVFTRHELFMQDWNLS